MSTVEFVLHAIVWGIVVIPLLVMSRFFLRGKGIHLIAGFNTMNKKELAQYDERAVCRFTGKCLLAMTFALMLIPVGIYTEIVWVQLCVLPIIVIGSIWMLVYGNTGGRFLKQGEVIVIEETENEKTEREKQEKKMEKYTFIAFGLVLFFPFVIPWIVILIVLFAQR